jgi:hypothetical protein
MNWEGCGRDWAWPVVRYCLIICLEKLKEKQKAILNSQSLDQDLKSGTPAYDEGKVTTEPSHLVTHFKDIWYKTSMEDEAHSTVQHHTHCCLTSW